MKKLIALLTLLGLNSCIIPAREPTVTLHADKSFTPDERHCIKSSADKWREQTSGLADANIVYDYDTGSLQDVVRFKLNDRLVRWKSTDELTKAFDEPDAQLLGQVYPKGGIHNDLHVPVEMRLVADRLTDQHKCQLTAIHEFGHVFGVPHIETKVTNIMYPMVLPTRTACLKKEDLLVFCLVNDCGRIEMKPCADQTDEELGINVTDPEG